MSLARLGAVPEITQLVACRRKQAKPLAGTPTFGLKILSAKGADGRTSGRSPRERNANASACVVVGIACFTRREPHGCLVATEARALITLSTGALRIGLANRPTVGFAIRRDARCLSSTPTLVGIEGGVEKLHHGLANHAASVTALARTGTDTDVAATTLIVVVAGLGAIAKRRTTTTRGKVVT